MTDSHVQVDPEGTGKLIDAESFTRGADTIHRQIVRTIPLLYGMEVAKGNVSGSTSILKYGKNADVDATQEDVWNTGGTRLYLAAAETMAIVGGANDDSPAGTGALTLYIEGLDTNYAVISETITMNGATPVTSANSYRNIHRAYVATAGTDLTNDGIITITPSGSGVNYRQATISAGDGQTFMTHYTVPNAKTGYLMSADLSAASGSGPQSKEIKVRFFIRPFGGAWRMQAEYAFRSDGSNAFRTEYPVPQTLAAKTDVRWAALSADSDVTVYVQYSLILVDD